MRGFGKLLVLLVLAVIGAATFYFLVLRKQPAPTPPAVPELVSLLPADATAFVFVDCVALRASPAVTRLLAAMPAPTEDKEYVEFVRATGFDYTRDLYRVAIAVEPRGQRNTALAVADGRFDRERISAYALRTGKRAEENGREVFQIPGRNSQGPIKLAILSATRIAISDGAPLASVFQPRASSVFDPQMQKRISRVSGAPVHALSRVGEIPRNLNLGGWVPDSLLDIARSVRWMTFAAKPEGDMVQVAVEAECDTPGNARQLSWTLDGARLIARMALSDPKNKRGIDPATLALLETVLRDGKIRSNDEIVRFSLELKSRDLEAVLQPTPSKSGR